MIVNIYIIIINSHMRYDFFFHHENSSKTVTQVQQMMGEFCQNWA